MNTDTTTCSFCSSSSTHPRPAAPQCRHQETRWNEASSTSCNPRQASNNPRRIVAHSQRTFVRSLALSIFCCFLFLCQGISATQIYGETEVLPRQLLFDRRPPPSLPHMILERRRDHSSSVLPSTTSQPADGSVSASPTETPSSTLLTATETNTALPRPFDTNIGNNFTTTTCPAFFTTFLSNQAFNDCVPFSLLLQTSNGFFTASRSLVRLTQTLDETCNVDYPKCSAVMAALASEIQSDSNCGPDLAMENPTVTQAYNGFVAYDTLYHAGCLTDSSGSYCYANAVTNATAPSSSYIYYLPLGVQLPGGSRPACTTCLQNTMQIFKQAAGNSTQPLSGDYVSAAEQVQMNCGPTFVQASVEMSSATVVTVGFGPLGLITLLVVVMNLFG